MSMETINDVYAANTRPEGAKESTELRTRISRLRDFDFSNNMVADFNEFLRLSGRMSSRPLLSDSQRSSALSEATVLYLACEQICIDGRQRLQGKNELQIRSWLELPEAEMKFLEDFLDYYQEA